MRHVEIALRDSERTNLEQRLTGRFYTPLSIAEKLAQEALSLGLTPNTIADPFCGDGRLIVAWLKAATRRPESLSKLRRILLWDYDGDSVERARSLVQSQLTAMGLDECRIEFAVGDTFERSKSFFGSVDVLLTNPPWELLKPDSRDGLGEGSEFKSHLRGYAARVARDFPGALSAKGKAMSGYGVNLARAGAIAAVMLASARGTVAIVLPTSIFADQSSGPFRREFFQRLNVGCVSYYPAEAKLFGGVDQSFVTVVGQAGSVSTRFSLTRFDRNSDEIESREIILPEDLHQPIALAVTGQHELIVRELEGKHPTLRTLEDDMRYGLWLGRELDETRLSDSITNNTNGVPFLKGRQVFPYRVISDEVVRIDPKKRIIPSTVRQDRLAWRDVSRPNQRRRMHVALVPQGYVTGNSLGVGFFRYGPPERLRVLMAVMNSMIFELQVRSRLATAHVSQGILRACVVPLACFEDEKLRGDILKLVEKQGAMEGELPELEVAVARAYGIQREVFATITEAFPKLTQEEREALLKKEFWQ